MSEWLRVTIFNSIYNLTNCLLARANVYLIRVLNNEGDSMKKIMMTISALFVLSASVSTSVSAQTNEESSAGELTNTQTPAQNAFIDPETGQLTSVPTDIVEPEASTKSEESLSEDSIIIEDAQSRSIDLTGVASDPQLMPDGSSKIEFNGQFIKPIKVQIDDNGTIQTGHHIENSSAEKDH